MKKYIVTSPRFSRWPDEIDGAEDLADLATMKGQPRPELVTKPDGIYQITGPGRLERVAVEEESFFNRIQSIVGTAVPKE